MAGFDIAGARSAGYSDAEIAAHLAKEGHNNFDFQGAAKAGYSPTEILNHLDPTPSGAMAGLAHGIMGVPEGMANTAKVYAGSGDTLPEADPDYKPAQIVPQDGHWYDPTSYNWSQVPQAVAEAFPGMATDIAAAKTGQAIGGAVGGVPGRLAGGAIGGVGSYLFRTRGDVAKHDAQIRTGDANAVPSAEDRTRSLATGAVEAIPQAVGVGRFLQGPARAGESAAARLAGTAATEAATGGAQNAIQQAGATIGTPGGLSVDPNQVAGAAVTSGVTGGALATPRALTDAHTGFIFRHIDQNPDLAPAAGALAQRIQDAAGGRNLRRPDVGGDAFSKAKGAIQSELGDAVKGIQTPLHPDAQNILDFIKSGKSPTDADYNTLTNALGNDPQAQNVLALARQAHVSNLVEDTGNLTPHGFTGGISEKVKSLSGLSGHSAGKAVAASLLAEHLGSHLIAYNPASLGLIAGAYGLTRLTDNLSGARSPAARFAQRYRDPNAQVRLAPPQPQQPPAPGQPPTGMGPWGPIPPGAQGGPGGPGGPVRPTGPVIPPAPVAPAPAPPTVNPLALPSNITGPAKNLMSGLAKARDMRWDYQGQEAAKSEVQNSPYIDQLVGGAQNVPTPQATKAMSKAVSGARVLAKLQSDPEAQAAAKAAASAAPAGPPLNGTPQPIVVQRVTKKAGNGKVEQETAAPDEGAYTPIHPDDFRNKGVSPAQIAQRDTNSGDYAPAIRRAYSKSIIASQTQRSQALTELAMAHPQDEQALGALLDQLKELSSGSEARKAISHFTKMMSPEGAAQTKAALNDDFIGRVWRKRR